MSAVEYLYAASFYEADKAARKRGVAPKRQSGMAEDDDTIVCFICLEEQLAAVPAGVTVHKVGRPLSR